MKPSLKIRLRKGVMEMEMRVGWGSGEGGNSVVVGAEGMFDLTDTATLQWDLSHLRMVWFYLHSGASSHFSPSSFPSWPLSTFVELPSFLIYSGIQIHINFKKVARIASVLERRIRDRKVSGSSSCRSFGEFVSTCSAFCADLFRYPFRPRVVAVARKRSRPLSPKCKWHVTTKHTCTLRMWLLITWHCKLVPGCIVYTEHAPRRQQFHVAPAM